MKRNIAIVFELLLVLGIIVLSITDGTGMMFFMLGAYILGVSILSGIGILVRKNNPKRISFLYPHIVLGVIVIPIGLTLTFSTDSWDAIAYAVLTIGVIMMIVASVPYYFILEDYITNLYTKENK